MKPMGPWPSPHLPGWLREMEKDEGRDGQLLHTPTSNTGTLPTFIHPGRGMLRHNKHLERRKKNFPTAEEKSQLTQFSAQKMLTVTLPQQKNNQNRTELRKLISIAGYNLHWRYRNCLNFCTHTTLSEWEREETTLWTMTVTTERKCLGDHLTHDLKGTYLRKWDDRDIDERRCRRHIPNVEWYVVLMDWKSPCCSNDSTLTRKSRESMPFLSQFPQIASDKDNWEFLNVSGIAKEPRGCPYTLQQEVQISDTRLPDLQLDCKPTTIKTAWYWHTRHPHRCREEKGHPEGNLI